MNEYEVMESWVSSPLDRAVDSAIAAENAAYLARPQAERDAEDRRYAAQTTVGLLMAALNPGDFMAARADYEARLTAALAQPDAWDGILR